MQIKIVSTSKTGRAIWLGAACSAALIAGVANEVHAQSSNLPSINVEEPRRQTATKPAQTTTAARSR
ncbi:hypothetical protein, partial [Klebsiella aerogenes]|uniref:hypothetical protein n=1 Tax=Klebsiella aerogenes TaxID=548 RepID=UPI0013D3E17C